MRGPRPRILANISIASRLSLVALLVTLMSLLVTAGVGLNRGDELASSLITDRMVTLGASRATELEIYVRNVRVEVAALGISPGTARAIEEFGAEYEALRQEPASSSEDSDLREFYISDIVPELQAVRTGAVDLTELIPTDPPAVHLQNAYTVSDDPVEGATPIDPALVEDAGDGSGYSAVHVELHAPYRNIGTRAGFDDLFLIDADRKAIVYSIRKRVDFATSLELGPYSGGTLASLIAGIDDDPEPGRTYLVDFAPYAPAADQPTAFAASPVFSDGDLIGYVAVALSADEINLVLTGDGDWAAFGSTGETYLAGPDATMRSDARPFIEDRGAFLDTDDDGGHPFLTPAQLDAVEAFDTTVLIQPVNRRVIDAAASGRGTMTTTNYAGLEVLTSYHALDIDDVDWVIFAELAIEEFDEPLIEYARDLIVAVALFVVAVTFIAVRWSTQLMAPIRAVAARLRAVRAGDGERDRPDTASPPGGDGSPAEYVALHHNIDDMIDRLEARRAEVEARSVERVDIASRFLPAAVARRVEATGGDVLDHVPHASVVVLILQGLGAVGLSGPENRELVARIVDEADGVAAEFGLDRIKVTGDAYYAVCGVSRPFLDHAPRSVGFALAVRDVVDEIAAAGAVDLGIAAGLDSGPVSVGLAARDGLVYDAWGPAVTRAEALGRRSGRGEITVSATVRGHLPAEFVFADEAVGDGAATVADQVASEGAGS